MLRRSALPISRRSKEWKTNGMPTSLQRPKPRLRDQILEQTFLFLRKFHPARERVRLGERNDQTERDHVARYQFAKQFCKGKKVADIACGTGYGSKILLDVAASVDSYDREQLCENRIIDLEKESWADAYDVIVSFETIEHLENPEFFLANIQKTSRLAIISSPIGEFRGYNPHHKQVWTMDEFSQLTARYFDCTYYYQKAELIHQDASMPISFAIMVGKPLSSKSSN